MAENRMADVAAMFGKKLGEPFIVEWEGKKVRVRFDEDYLCILEFGYGWHTVMDKILRELLTFTVVPLVDSLMDKILRELLTGEAVIVNE